MVILAEAHSHSPDGGLAKGRVLRAVPGLAGQRQSSGGAAERPLSRWEWGLRSETGSQLDPAGTRLWARESVVGRPHPGPTMCREPGLKI